MVIDNIARRPAQVMKLLVAMSKSMPSALKQLCTSRLYCKKDD